MLTRITRSRKTRIVDLIIASMIIGAISIGVYNYYFVTLPPPLKKAEFQVTNLTVNPAEAGVSQPITISANVTNVGEEAGNYSVNLAINDVVRETKTVQLSGNESRIVEFSVTENNEGSYSVEIAGLNGTFIITAAPPPDVFKVSDLSITPYEGWPNEPIKISVKVSNIGDETYSYSLAFRVNEEVRETKTIQLSAGETTTVETNVVESSEGRYSVIVGGETGAFRIVPTGKHTLTIAKSGSSGSMSFTLDGASVSTTFSELLDVGMHTISVPMIVETETAVFEFQRWQDGDTSATRTIDLQERMILVATYLLISGYASCPALYVWNGTDYVYRTEVTDGTGWLGFVDYFQEDGSMVFAYNDPWDYIKLDGSQLQPRNGYFDMIVIQKWDEISYLDAAKLMVVDHPPDVDVFSNKGTYIYNLEDLGKIYTVSKNPLMPISAINGEGQDVLPQISELDEVYTAGHLWKWDSLELNLGDLSGAKEIKLLVAGITVWPTNEEGGAYVAQFFTQPGVKPFPSPYMEVKDENGDWVRVPESRQFPYLDVTDDILVVNMTGLFPTSDYSLRIHTIFDMRFDYIGVDTTPQQNVIIRQIYPVSDLAQAFTTYSTSTGNFTRYGDVTQLVRYADDKFVIIRRGDQVHLKFPIDIEPVPENMERDYFLFASNWFKCYGLPYIDYSVDPLPFHDMSAFPYPPTESYPYDEDHLQYLREYNTRETALHLETQETNRNYLFSVDAIMVADGLVIIPAVIYMEHKVRQRGKTRI